MRDCKRLVTCVQVVMDRVLRACRLAKRVKPTHRDRVGGGALWPLMRGGEGQRRDHRLPIFLLAAHTDSSHYTTG